MTRFFAFSLAVALASYVPIHAQPKSPPKSFTNAIGMKFVWIPPGSFMMGSPKEEMERGEGEIQHKGDPEVRYANVGCRLCFFME